MDGFLPYAAQPQTILALTATGGPLNPLPAPPSLHLFQNNLVPNVNTKLADFTEANFVGYVARNVTMGGFVFRDPTTGQYFLPSTGVEAFTAGAIVGPQTVYGWYLLDANGLLYACGRLSQPVTFTVTGDTLLMDFEVRNPQIVFPDPQEP